MLYLKPKQQQAIDAVNDPTVHTLVLIGAVGTGKTDIAAHIGLSICDSFANTYWTVFRQNISTAKRSVIPSYLNMLEMMNFVEGRDYTYNKQDFEIKFPNKSLVGFIEADFTKDRQGRKIKGINASNSHIDEADELHQTMFTTALSRRGRRNKFGQPSISIVTMNANDTYLKEMYYDPWKAGTLPPGVVVIEFTIEDSWQSKQDIDAMLTNPEPWVQRYIYNNWSYHPDQDSLFKYKFFDAGRVSSLEPFEALTRYTGYDVARTGSDRSVVALWYGNCLVDIQVVKDHDEQMTTDDQALWLIRYITENAVIPDHTAVDAVGVGVGVVDFMKSRGMRPYEFISGATAPSERYDKLRSQVIYTFAQGLEKGTIKIYEGCPFRNELISEAMAHNHKIGDKKLAVESKDEVKKRTGSLSPDLFDAVIMGLAKQLNIDPNSDWQNSISW